MSLLAVGFLFLKYRGVTHISREEIDHLQDFIRGLGFWGPASYILLSTLATIFLFPATPIVLTAGVFGVVWGSAYAIFSLSTGGAISFLLARHTLRRFIAAWVAQRPFFKKLDEGVRREGAHMVFVTRLVPAIPFTVQNYAYGLTQVPFWTHLLVTTACITPPVIAYVFIGSSLISGEGEIKRILLYVAVGGIILAALSLLPRWLLRRSNPLKEATPQEPGIL